MLASELALVMRELTQTKRAVEEWWDVKMVPLADPDSDRALLAALMDDSAPRAAAGEGLCVSGSLSTACSTAGVVPLLVNSASECPSRGLRILRVARLLVHPSPKV